MRLHAELRSTFLRNTSFRGFAFEIFTNLHRLVLSRAQIAIPAWLLTVLPYDKQGIDCSVKIVFIFRYGS